MIDPASGFDPLLQPPARLQIAAVLAQAQQAEFTRLKAIIAASDSVTSKHLSALSEAGYVTVTKAPSEGRQRTWASLTGKGRRALDRHVAALRAIIDAAPLAAE